MLVASDSLSSRDISHFLWVVSTSMTVKILIQRFPKVNYCIISRTMGYANLIGIR